MNKLIEVSDSFQKNYSYYRTEKPGEKFHPDFEPQLTPKQMLNLGVFGGKYLCDCREEFPKSWFSKARLSPQGKNISLNFFNADASQSLKEWQKKGWIYHEDPRGWFQWYCRYYMGRRIEKEDLRQIKRWRGIRRHWAAVQKNCECYDFSCRKKQRQALLHWAYDSRNL
jgi:hypothetical protein